MRTEDKCSHRSLFLKTHTSAMMNVTNEHRTETFTLYNHVTVTLEQINSESLKQKG